jgi:branched-chain amino acid transport system substrate-binding protein
VEKLRVLGPLPGAQLANSYAGCQLFVEAVRRAGSLDSDKLREVLLALKTKTVLDDFAVDDRGFQVGHKAITIQWQDGKQVVVWPDELASETSIPDATMERTINV